MSRADSSQDQSSFQVTLRRALERVGDPAWLAANSPLATPYFLGERGVDLEQTGSSPLGRALQTLLYETADSLWEGGPPPTSTALISAVEEARQAQGNAGDEYAYMILELRYFRRYFQPGEYPVESADIAVYLAVSDTRFFVHLREAIDRLGQVLLRRVQPAVRLERPQSPEIFIGRSRELGEIAAALTAGNSVSLTGPPGAGKTTLSTVVGEGWPGGHAFWYTFIPGLNDTLDALFFALAHFARDHGGNALWAYLAVRNGELDPAQAAGLLRADLAMMDDPPLLILDEVDLLRTSDGEPRSAIHSQLLFFLESLVAMAPTLLIGQRAYVDTPVFLSLPSLDEDGVVTLLDSAGTHLPRSQARRVYDVTGGLPRLVWLVIALLRSGEDVEEMTRLPLRGDAVPLFHRLWRRLGREEKELLVALSVFRRPTPGDAWTRHEVARHSLYERRLLDLSDPGEIALLPFFQRLIYQELRQEQREQFHLQAGYIRAERGEYTAAAYHFAQANEPELAVDVWFPQRELEIGRGQAGAALEVFAGISAKGMSKTMTRRLKVIQNQLYLLAGETNQVAENVHSITWDMDDTLTAEAYAQAGRAVYVGGNVNGALTHYAKSIEVLGIMIREIMDKHLLRGRILLDEGDLKAAQVEALLAEQRLITLRGQIAYINSDYEDALEDQAALQIAEGLQRADLIAESKRRVVEV
ncbi:MAG: hypothetical protein R3C44_24680 [Chloroflexota bacterium]